jgi:hypothetical protein
MPESAPDRAGSTHAILELLADRCAEISAPAFEDQGWSYGNGGTPSKAELRKMVLGLMERAIEAGNERREWFKTRCGRFVVELRFDHNDLPELDVYLDLGGLYHADVPLSAPVVTP